MLNWRPAESNYGRSLHDGRSHNLTCSGGPSDGSVRQRGGIECQHTISACFGDAGLKRRCGDADVGEV